MAADHAPSTPQSTRIDLKGALVAGALPGEADDLDEQLANEIADFALEAARGRKPGEAKLVIAETPGERPRRSTSIAISNDDMPFLVDSVTNAISARGFAINRLLHPILDVARDAHGDIRGLAPADREILPEGTNRESLIYLEMTHLTEEERQDLERELTEVLVDVRLAVADWRTMLSRLARASESLGAARIAVPADEVVEAKAFLEWLGDDNFTFLGFAAFSFASALTDHDAEPEFEDGLGLLRDPDFPLFRGAKGYERLPPALREFMATPQPLLITKSNAVSRVHRNVYFDAVSVKRFDDQGQVCGEYRFIGLFTSAALSSPPNSVPIIRRKVAAVRERLGFDPSGHSGKALNHVLETLPRGELFLTDEDRLTEMARGMLSLLDRPRPKVFTRVDPFERFVSAVVFIPREIYTSELRRKVGDMLAETFNARLARFDVELRAQGLARVQFYLGTDPGQVPDIAEKDLDRRLGELVRGWNEQLETEAIARFGDERGETLARVYEAALSTSYRDQFSPAEAVKDIEHLEALEGPEDREVQFYRKSGDEGHDLRIKIYRRGNIIPLSEMVPVLEAFGFQVIEEFPFDAPAGDGGGWIHDFLVHRSDGEALDLDFLKTTAAGALRAVLLGEQENDAFNSLVTAVELGVEEVAWLRAYFRYLRQSVLPYGLATVVEALARNPVTTRALVQLFCARFALDVEDRAAAIGAAQDAVTAGLRDVEAIDEDRILRRYAAVIGATLRTTAFCAASRTLAFKIDSGAVPGLPAPVPYREIWVYSPRVEGVHLRGGPIARGGLRWSDRRDDFRTEILGLVKAQMVKNAVIVPTGAKGGFYPKQLPPMSDRDAWLTEGQAAYRIFIEALLSLTDNVKGNETVPPEGVVCHDDPDPYLVVAADKGTATFSDLANSISQEHGFWLGDAFASGGAHGYDHKKMGITARGAWVSVQRHFREMGIDIQSDPVRVIGVGDMSGDVFGNGMLLSKTLKLVAAFDHRHIFIDPDPDPAASWAERSRMFALPRSSWEDYDQSLISKGGGVFSRAQKSISPTPEMQELLGIGADDLAPTDLLSAILKADADLLWFGGIGTYVKAAGESDADVGDRANDPIRVNARDLRVRVIGEGANLGITQPGRISFSAAGGRVNTDFIDNSAGVDCSDNEVNIKVALQDPLRAGTLEEEDRNALLAEMTEEVAALVLRDNVMQTQALSVAEAGGPDMLPSFQRVLQEMETQERIDRVVEQLPGDDQLQQRAAGGRGLERPELAVLLAHAKIALYEAIVESPLPDDPALVEDLEFAFPDRLKAEFLDQIHAHRLRREIIATKIANQIVNRGGIAIAFELAEEHSVPLARVAAAFVTARELFRFRTLWRTIDAAALDPRIQIALHRRSGQGLRTHMSDLIDALGPAAMPSETVAMLRPGLEELRESVGDILGVEPRAAIERGRQSLAAEGAPEELTEKILEIESLDGAALIAKLAHDKGMTATGVAKAYTRIGSALGLDWAHATAAYLEPADPWERLLASSLARDFEVMRLDLVGSFPAEDGADAEAEAERWLESRKDAVANLSATIDRARASGVQTPAMLAHLASQARSVLSSGF
ncbi:glutamate dehydrogenase [Pacificimonas flava]|uniref:Glutamate dehydrogenase n=2 Tax=Pacificimonas TaxID=1960290 RepID=A0A219B2C0_9SPHN|nr:MULTISPECIES: NAD-glutamate dehydrogenase [Pacificimonas]MBZ6377840.1 NAD-glutamate dehydrogenase [Pacificimonas aurantium]OWV32497.1 glutamate dehydrogenase [Pacificimonas flava]